MKPRFRANVILLSVMETFVMWLTDELNKRGWSNSELGRRAGVTHTAISMVISGHNNPGPDMCKGIARAFKIPPELVFRKAGILPSLPDDFDLQQMIYLQDHFKHLPSKVREDIIDYVVYKYKQEQED